MSHRHRNPFRMLVLLAASAALALGALAHAQDEPNVGGTLTVGFHSSLEVLDVMGVTATRDEIWQMVFEPLVTMDANLEAVGLLAESWSVSDDGLSWTFDLRQGVTFHDGEPMTSADVVASFERLMDIGARRSEFARITSVEAIDDHTVVFHTDEPWGALPETFSMPSGAFVVYPAWVVEQLGSDLMSITDFDLMIGTGPYYVEEVIPAERLVFNRFDDYTQPHGEPSGWAGPRGQYLDQIVVLPITDEATRSLALFAGEVHVADQLAPEDVARLEADPGTVAAYREPGRRTYLKMNDKNGPFTDPLLRRAVQVAIDLEEAMFTQGPPESWRANPFVRYQEGQWMWDGELLAEYFPADLERGRQLVAESSYDGELIRYLTRPDLPDQFRPTSVILELLQDLGLNAELMVVDGATFTDVRRDLTGWEIKSAGGGSVVPLSYLDASGIDRNGEPWNWVGDEWFEQLEIIANDLDEANRLQAVHDLNIISAEAAGEIWLGDLFSVVGVRANVRNVPDWHYMRLFDIWLD